MDAPEADTVVLHSAAANINNATTPEAETTKRKRQPRNSACQPCAALKMKCIASPEADKCERCHRMRKDCLPAVPKPRKRRTQSGIGTDSPKGFSISDIVDKHPPSSPPRVPRHVNHDESSKTALSSQLDITHIGSQSFIALFQQHLGLDSSAAELLQGIDYNHVQTSFVHFRQMLAHFPFVALRLDSEAVTMVSTRPMTTLAICVVTTASNADLQERLTQVFRLAISSKVFVARERSLDLMVGLLIWLAWHHFYMIKQQIYQEACLLAGMAAGLGLYDHQSTVEDAATAVERNRAFLGCYYLCCGLSMSAFNKPSPMRWTANLRRFADELAYAARVPSDRTLVGIIELVYAMQDLDEDLRPDDPSKRSSSFQYVDLHIKAANQRLKSLRREHPTLAGTLGFAAATINLHHRLLKRNENPETSTLIQCACAVKDYLDDILDRPSITLHQIDIIDWTNMLEILILMARMSKPLPHGVGWEAGAVSSMLQPESILDAFSSRMAAAAIDEPLAPRMDITFQWFKHVCGGIKNRILHDRGAGAASGLRNHDPNIEIMGSLGSSFRPVNHPDRREPAAPAADVISGIDMQIPALVEGEFGSLDLFGAGVLDEAFWNNFMW